MENLTKKQKILIGILSVFILFGGYIFLKFKNNDDIIVENAIEQQTETVKDSKEIEKESIKQVEFEKPKKLIIVHISGRVKSPGIAKLEEGSRIFEAVQSCGGMLGDADADKINLAEILTDGQKVYIPKIGEIIQNNASQPSIKSSANVMQGMVNINSATEGQFDSLPEIGPSTARKIIEYRNSKGPFKSVNDLKNVPGIGEKKLEKIKKYITV